jgi:membrane protease YdiL (CAAX protease family)
VSIDNERVHDWVLTGIAVAMAGLWMWTFAATPQQAGPVDVRTIEDFGRIHDAGESYPTVVRDLIGLEGTSEDTPKAIVEAAHERAIALPPSRDLRLVVVAMAAAWGVQDVARDEIAAMSAGDAMPEALQLTVADLERLARGAPIDTIDRVVATLTEAGASSWLLDRVRSRHYAIIGDTDRAAATDRAAIATATRGVDVKMVSVFAELGLVALGFIMLFLVPFLRPRLARRGYGLGSAPSPFLLARTQRVVVMAFVAFLLTSLIFGLVAGSLGATGPTPLSAGLVAMQILTQGAIWLALIQHYGRASDDHRPLSPALGLGVGMLPGRGAALAAWIIPGIAMCAFVTIAAQFLTLFLFGPPSSTQSSIDILLGDGSVTTFALLVLGAAVFAPLVEEILFRGFLFRNLRGSVGVATAVVFSGLVFGAVHLDPERLLPLSALGAMLALLYEWSGSLLVPVIVHGLWNLLQLVGVWVIYHGT